MAIYDNYKVYDNNGDLLFTCSKKRAAWYLRKGLAVKTGESELHLTFKPAGPGCPFKYEGRRNACVCCGSETHLTRHHIIPRCYRRHFPAELKDFASYDVMPLCTRCHELYETEAERLKRKLNEQYGWGVRRDNVVYRVKNAASALALYRDYLPYEREEYFLSILKEYFQKDEIAEGDIDKATALVYYDVLPVKPANYVSFIRLWRQHFVDVLRPLYLPKYWSINYEYEFHASHSSRTRAK